MTIALDFDGCYDKAPALFNQFIRTARDGGHRVLIVSSRSNADGAGEGVIKQFMLEQGCQKPLPPVFCTGGSAKEWWLMSHYSILVDVWIDDDPRCIANGK